MPPTYNPLPEGFPIAYSFRDFLFKIATNKKYLLIALAGTIAQFVLFKLCYPFADYFNDSYTYINAAAEHHIISYRPIGYSRFLEMIHFVTSSDTVLIFIQYFSIQAGSLLLFFTVCYFFPVHKTISHLLFAMLIFNPIILYISNYVSSDALFISLSLFWIIQLLWIINRPAWHHLLIQGILLFLIFKLRYAALYLPAISVFAFLLSRKKWFFQLAGLALTIIPLFIEVKRIEYLTRKETGTSVFSAFSGWVTVSNALSIYPNVNITDSDFPSADCRALHTMVKQYFDTLPPSKRPSETSTFALMWGRNTPLKNYMRYNQRQRKVGGYFNAWHAVGPVFSEYGQTVIRKNPIAYAAYFMWPNVKNFFGPQLESLSSYNEERETVDGTAIQWFRYKSPQVHSINKNFNEQFWDEELSCYVLALDGRKKSCRVVTSNAGHCLFTSIADDEKAKKLAKRLLQPDMFTGWGIRTLGMWEKRYNPMSYHNGSVWPHDVAIIGRGFSKYGLIPETLQITSALFDASLFIELQRLPELFCGFDRRIGEGPTNYPVACSPQAWSVGAVFMLLEACLHMDIYAAQKKVYFYNPVIPEGIDEVTISGLKLGEEYANFKLFSKNSTIGIKVMDCPPGWQILIIAEHEPEFP